MDDIPLASLSLTHVRYNPSDPLSFASAWLALVPQALCVIYVTLIWSTREVEVLLMFAGQMACELFNFGLKRLIREERPQQMHGKGYGMPSSHAQFVSFFSISLTLFLLFRHQPSSLHPTSNSNSNSHAQTSTEALIYPTYSPYTITQRALLSLLALGGASLVAISRIYLSYHTPRQVVVGVVAGAIFAIFWFGFGTLLRREGWIEWGLETALARMVRMRDLIVSEDLQDAGWGRWEARRKLLRKRGRGKNI